MGAYRIHAPEICGSNSGRSRRDQSAISCRSAEIRGPAMRLKGATHEGRLRGRLCSARGKPGPGARTHGLILRPTRPRYAAERQGAACCLSDADERADIRGGRDEDGRRALNRDARAARRGAGPPGHGGGAEGSHTREPSVGSCCTLGPDCCTDTLPLCALHRASPSRGRAEFRFTRRFIKHGRVI